MLTRNTKVALTITLFFLLCGMGLAQDWRWQRGDDRDRDDRYSDRQRWDRKWYDRGFRDARNDREHRRRPHPRHNGNRDYMAGYHAGYGEFRGWRDNEPVYRGDDRGNMNNYPYPNRGYQNVQRIAYENGFREGERYGLNDRNTGHSNRPTYSDMFKNGSAGYTSSMGDKSAYRQAFQEGFRSGYERGYNSGYRR
jgi:hypothetical protein